MSVEYTDGIAYERSVFDPRLPTIIFLHDSLGCIQLWRSFPAKLGETANCNTIVYDRLGYGQSSAFKHEDRHLNYMELEADKLIELLDKWGLEQAILFGHSDGGSIAIIAAGKYPDRIRAIITEGAHVFVEPITLKGIEEAVDLYAQTDLRVKLAKYHGNKTQKMFDAWSKTWTQPFFKDWNIESFVRTMKCPSLVIQGENDEYGSLAQVNSISEQSGGIVTTLILPDTKHTPHKEKTEVVLTASNEFIRMNVR